MQFLERGSCKPPKSQDHETNQNRFALQSVTFSFNYEKGETSGKKLDIMLLLPLLKKTLLDFLEVLN